MGEDEDTPLAEVVGIYNKMHPQDRVRVLAFFENTVECHCRFLKLISGDGRSGRKAGIRQNGGRE